jgi:FkbM family methyltransferase
MRRSVRLLGRLTSAERQTAGVTGALAARAHLAGRAVLNAVVQALPPAVADRLRHAAPDPGSVPGRARRRLLGVLRRGGIPRRVGAFPLADNPRVRFVNADSLVLQQLYWYGEQGWEPDLLAWWRYFCARSVSVLELGANVGYFSVQGAAAAPLARYVAVEPHPASVAVCRANVALNGIDWVDVVAAAAVADGRTTSVELAVPWEQLATPTVAFLRADTELPDAMAARASSSVRIPAVDVRPLLDGVDLLKLDVEGQEHALLSAALPQLAARRPTILVEVLPGTSRLRGLLRQLCDQHGYRCYAPGRRGVTRVEPSRLPTVRLDDEYGGHDVILTADADFPP